MGSSYCFRVEELYFSDPNTGGGPTGGRQQQLPYGGSLSVPSVLCEYMPLGSLDTLVQSVGGLPESALREVRERCKVRPASSVTKFRSWPAINGYLTPHYLHINIY